MQVKVLTTVLIVFMVLLALSIYFMVDAFNHMKESLEIQREFKPLCSGMEIINCTTKALQKMVESTQHLLIAVVELTVSAVFLVLAVELLTASMRYHAF